MVLRANLWVNFHMLKLLMINLQQCILRIDLVYKVAYLAQPTGNP